MLENIENEIKKLSALLGFLFHNKIQNSNFLEDLHKSLDLLELNDSIMHYEVSWIDPVNSCIENVLVK